MLSVDISKLSPPGDTKSYIGVRAVLFITRFNQSGINDDLTRVE